MSEPRRASIDPSEPKRIKAFRLYITKTIPKFPNNKETLERLQNESIVSLLVHYTNWAIRYVPNRSRAVHVESTASSDARWHTLSKGITTLLDKVKNGEDLTPHLSLEPHTRGYTPASSGKGPGVDRWADKDFLLNVMGYYHFHLGLTIEPKGSASRTDELLFAKVSREQFTVIGIFDHSVFDRTVAPTGEMTKERDRLWKLFLEHSAKGLPPGSVFAPTMVATSGHSLPLVMRAQEYYRVMKHIDPKVDDMDFIREIYRPTGVTPPKKPKLSWHLNGLDLGLLDSQSSIFFVLRFGPV